MVRVILQGDGIQYEGEISFDEAVALLKQFQGMIRPAQAMQRLWADFTRQQQAYCRATNNGWILNSRVRELLGRNLAPQAIAGIRRGLNMKARRYLNEEIDEQEWDESADPHQNKYRIKPKFREALTPLL